MAVAHPGLALVAAGQTRPVPALLLASPVPLRPAAAVSAWQAAPVVDAGLVLAVVGYAYLAWRVRRRHPARPWPAARSTSLVAGLAVIAVATQSVVAVDDGASFTAHMVQHVLLIMVAPPLLVYGRPVTLLLHAVGNPVHRYAVRLLRSAPVRALTWPAGVTVAYAIVVAVTHTPPVMNLVLRSELAHDAEHALYLVTGYLYFLPIIGSEPLPGRVFAVGRYLMLVVGMQVDTAVGVLLAIQGHEVFAGYAAATPPPGLSRVADLRFGGIIMWVGSDLVMVVVALAVAVSLVARRPGAPTPAPAAEEALLAAHNAAIERLDARHSLRVAAVARVRQVPQPPPGPQ